MAASIVVLLATGASFGASIDLVQEYSFTVPMADTIRQIAFGDIDNDGTPEVLARTDHAFALFSILNDSILFQQSYASDTFVTYVMIGDVNRDQVKDVMVGRSCVEGELDIQLAAFDPASSFSIVGTFNYDLGGGAIGPGENRIYFLKSVDINNDGINELLFSYDKQYCNWTIGDHCWSEGYSYLFSRFPDSMIWEEPIGCSTAIAANVSDSTLVLVSPREFDGFTFHESSWYYDVMTTGVVGSDGTILPVAAFVPEMHCASPPSYIFVTKPECGGELIPENGSQELLVTGASGMYCGPNESYSDAELQLRRLTPGDTNNLIWSRPPLGDSYAIHPAFPGYFLSLGTEESSSDGLVKLFRGNDAQEMARSISLPAGIKELNLDFPDSLPRVVSRLDNQVRVFVLGISTAVESDNPSEQLPLRFTLNRPYPNPFNAEITIPLSLPHRADVKIEVYNLLGQKIAELWEGSMIAGEQVVRWNAGQLPSAVYFVKVAAMGETKTAKVVLLK